MLRAGFGLTACLGLAAAAAAQTVPPDPAAAFGARERVQAISLSPDGRTVAFVQPIAGQGSAVYVADLDAPPQPRLVTQLDGRGARLRGCDFVSARRLVCDVWAIRNEVGVLTPISRTVSFNIDGSNSRVLGERDTADQQYARLTSGRVIDYLPGDDDAVLMAQTFVPEARPGTRLLRQHEGLGVVRVDTGTLQTRMIEAPSETAVHFITDGRGRVRIRGVRPVRGATGLDSPILTFSYRPAAGGAWREFSRYDTATGRGRFPLAVDPELDAAYVFERLNGRDALYRIALDPALTATLVAAHEQVDVDTLIRVGRRNRVVGVSFATERREAVYFDPELRQLAERLRRALPSQPLIQFVDASEDESRLLIFAGGDTDPGRYYTYDKGTRRLREIMLARPELEGVPLAAVRPVSYRAADGTAIPAYLTLPPGAAAARGLPALVMPHGGPGARDEWGFDWLAQYFAHRGYAVLQPNFRGSSGYGEAWFRDNGFRSWRTAIGDVGDAGRWLVSEGIADPAKLAILGWSYGGYAALQAGVIAPDLYKAVVAVAPVTDLNVARNEWNAFSSAANVREFFGEGPHLQQGSPAQNAAAIRAPVLLFHGDNDRNVGVRQSQLMHDRLRAVGGRSELVLFPGLDHQLDDSAARADLLRRADAFLRASLGIR